MEPIVESLRGHDPDRRSRSLQAERHFLRMLRHAMQEPLDPTPGDFGLDRLMNAIDAHESVPAWRRLLARLHPGRSERRRRANVDT